MPDDLQLLRFIIKKEYADVKKQLLNCKDNGKSFTEFAHRHRLAGHLYSAHAPCLNENFPEETMQSFKDAYIKQWGRNQVLCREVETLGVLFREEGLDMIFLKGLFLAQRFFGDMFGRAISDIDILVKKRKDVDTVHRLLTRHNFRRTSRVPLSKYLAFCFSHHYEYRKKDIDVELHWGLQSHVTFHINYDDIWQTRETVTFRNKSYFVLSNEYELLALILSIFTDLQKGGIDLKPFVDVYVILKIIHKKTSWKDFFSRRSGERLFLISLNVLDLVLDILDCYDHFTELSEYISQNKIHLKYIESDRKLRLLDTSRFGMKNKKWSLRLYETSLFNSICWWGISLPFRMAVYRENKQ
ncbi:MAG: hypothetical protein AMK71_00280 [Nitrospira bacterium SG8_35_4]|nr:MAG: hypothetical protein AMK71_00280 [Nitrospira bacterium SG8_35_4]